jgi:hypothetical protein
MNWFKSKKEEKGIEEYIGKRVLMKHWDVASGLCGPCWIGPYEGMILRGAGDYVEIVNLACEWKSWKNKYRVKVVEEL